MANRSTEEDVVERGTWGEVRFAVTANGDRPARVFILGLKKPEQAKLIALFRMMANHGHIVSGEKFRKEQGEIYAFKSFQIRIACFNRGRIWFLTHGFRKKSDKWPETELARARRIREEHIDRK